MRNILLFIGLLSFNFVDAQDTLELEISNPAPRIGDEVELSFSFDFFTDDINKQLNDDIILSSASPIFGGSSQNFDQVIEFTKTGTQTIGPFKFEFNGSTIVTDSITLIVEDELPFEEGAWLRIIRDQEGNQFLIIEQLIQNKSNYQETENGYLYSVGGEMDEETEFAELNEVNEPGLSISFSRSVSKSRSAENDDIFAPGMTYSFRKYEINFTDNFKGTFILKKRHFKNLPNRVHFTDLRVKR